VQVVVAAVQTDQILQMLLVELGVVVLVGMEEL
jgi:hypothetical protein